LRGKTSSAVLSGDAMDVHKEVQSPKNSCLVGLCLGDSPGQAKTRKLIGRAKKSHEERDVNQSIFKDVQHTTGGHMYEE